MKFLLIALLSVLLIGCKSTPETIVDTRPPAQVETVRYVPIKAELTKATPIAEGPLSQVIDVARERKKQLQDCNADKAEIAGIAGTPVPC